MYSYEVTYETMDGSHTTINISSTNLIKAAQFAEKFSFYPRQRLPRTGGSQRAHIRLTAETPARASARAGRLALMMAGQRVLQHPGRGNAQTTGILWNDTQPAETLPACGGYTGGVLPGADDGRT